VQVVQLPGAYAVPGLGDAHVHLDGIGSQAEMVDLAGTTSVAEVQTRIADFARTHPELRAIVGINWDQTRLTPPEFPGAADLRGVDPGGRPLVLWRVDGHALWLDEVAMGTVRDYFAVRTGGPQAASERILRDASGAPTGIVVDPDPRLYAALVPAPTRAEFARWLGTALPALAAAGLVEAHDMGVTVAELEALMALAAAPGGLPLRVIVYLKDEPASWEWLTTHAPGPVVLGPDLEVRGIKLFADGALGSRGAALKAPYSDEPAHRGQPADPETLVRAALRADGLGYQVAIHAIGDAGNANALTAIERARAAWTLAGSAALHKPWQAAAAPLRHRVEHVQVLDLATDLARLRASDAVASMQPTHATSDMRWAEARLGPERILGAYAWRALLSARVPLAFGSDAPVEAYDPRLGLWAATTRQALGGDGVPEHGWYTKQIAGSLAPGSDADPTRGLRERECLTLVEALRAFSAGVAYAAQGETERGALAVGQLLELTLFDRVLATPVDLDPTRTAHASVVGTVRRGRLQPARASAAPQRTTASMEAERGH
jgi:predicted amidohydrolase YtcJ